MNGHLLSSFITVCCKLLKLNPYLKCDVAFHHLALLSHTVVVDHMKKEANASNTDNSDTEGL